MMAIVLIIQDGDQVSKVKLTAKPVVFGRSSKCAVKINDGMCSGQHCAFVVNQHFRVLVKDLESTNGTFLNDCKIMDSHLMLDDVVKIGDCEIFIDPSELSPKEKKILTRDEPTSQIKFVNLPSERKTVKPSQVVRAKKLAQVEEEAKTVVQKVAPKQAKPVQEKKEKPAALEKSREQKRIERLKEKAKKFGKGAGGDLPGIESERQIDLEESSGNTQMIKISKPTKKKKSLGSKIKGVFKK
jgi:pSer/pThr/pTyr-binding forkhead associated (FHA) protein